MIKRILIIRIIVEIKDYKKLNYDTKIIEIEYVFFQNGIKSN